MEGGFFLIFVIIAMAARAIEALSKNRQRGEGPPPPPQRRPRPEYQRPHGTTARDPEPPHEVGRDETADAAAEMIPDELWQILTGQPKPRRQVPAPQPQQYHYDEAGIDEEAVVEVTYPDEEAEYERRLRAEQEARAREARELQERRMRGRNANTAEKAPAVVSLERLTPSPEKRHAAFHAKVDRPLVVETLTPRRSAREWLFEDDDLKRAVVLQEVLGTPKGLQ